jgi:uncharacterized protein (DUF885 family)
MKPKRPAKPETKHSIATKLATEFQVSVQTATQWFDAGCPMDYQEAVQWKLQKRAQAAIKSEQGSAPNKLEKALQQAAACEETVNWDAMSTQFRQMCDIVAEFFLLGMTVNSIHSKLGVAVPVINRIIANHPDTKEKEAQARTNRLREIARLSSDALVDMLGNPTQLAKMKPAELNFILGTAQDKLRDSEGGAQLTISIHNKINSLSFEELIASIPKQVDAIDAEFEIETPSGTSSGVKDAVSKPPLSLNKSTENEPKSDASE